jgi:predicted P-loop ATPase
VLPIWWIVDGKCACGSPANAPCASPGKHPIARLVRHGALSATRDRGVVEGWLRTHPLSNWAVATGREVAPGKSLLVLDVDPRNDGDTTMRKLEAEHGKLPVTPVCLSGGNGYHVYLVTSTPLACGQLGDEGIDVKGVGGYVLAPPSNHYSGGVYRWEGDDSPDVLPIAEAPEWVLVALTAQKARPQTSEGQTALETVFGEAFRLAGWLGRPFGEGRYMARCPWAHEHSDATGQGSDTSSVLLPPTMTSDLGNFKCLHGHCSARTWRDVQRALPESAWVAGIRKYPIRPRVVATGEEAPPGVPATPSEDPGLAVLPFLSTRKGTPTNVIANVLMVLARDARWTGVIAYDSFRDAPVLRRQPPQRIEEAVERPPGCDWSDEDATRTASWLHAAYGIDVKSGIVHEAMMAVARKNVFHPVRAYLDSLVWDGVPRVDTFLATHCGSPATDYGRGVSRLLLLSAVARVRKPGCKVDTIPILEGHQGQLKSTLLAVLAGEWFADTPFELGNKDSYQVLHGVWIYELGELAALKGRDATRIKSFASSGRDTYRPSYGRRPVTVDRQCTFVGTTNDDHYLDDPTGGRRFWPLPVGDIDIDAVRRDRDQLWAEASARIAAGEAWWPSRELSTEGANEQADRFAGDPWDDVLTAWLAKPEKTTWKDGRSTTAPLDIRQGVAMADVLESGAGVTRDRQTKEHQRRASVVLKAAGWSREKSQRRTGNGQRGRYWVPAQAIPGPDDRL